jgi:uncharacterized membrane protein YdbT with pleckstrin-like domain
MTDVIIRPTLKFIKTGYVVVVLLIAVAGYFAYQYPDYPWLPAVAAVLLIWPIQRQLRRQVSKLVITGDKLRYEIGFLSKNTRTISLAKVQDVSVHQTLGQRLTNTGDLSIETAGESSRLTVRHIDRPQAIADQLHEASVAAAREDLLPPGTGKGQKA